MKKRGLFLMSNLILNYLSYLFIRNTIFLGLEIILIFILINGKLNSLKLILSFLCWNLLKTFLNHSKIIFTLKNFIKLVLFY